MPWPQILHPTANAGAAVWAWLASWPCPGLKASRACEQLLRTAPSHSATAIATANQVTRPIGIHHHPSMSTSRYGHRLSGAGRPLLPIAPPVMPSGRAKSPPRVPLVPARVTAALVAVLPEQLDRTAQAGYPRYFWSQVRNPLEIALPSQGAAAARPDAAGRLGHYHSWQGNFGPRRLDRLPCHGDQAAAPGRLPALHPAPRQAAYRGGAGPCYPCGQCSRSPGPGSLNPLVQGSTSGAPPAKRHVCPRWRGPKSALGCGATSWPRI